MAQPQFDYRLGAVEDDRSYTAEVIRKRKEEELQRRFPRQIELKANREPD